MADRTVRTILRAEIAPYTAAMRKASTETLDFASKNKQSINEVSNKVGLLGAGLVGLAAVAVKRFADFDHAMSAVAATGEDARASIDELRDAAIQAGQDTVFSATEAAAGVENLAKAGVSAADILAGGLKGALDLAAAGEIEVADAAEIAATAMTQFKLSGRDVPHIADLLAAAAGKAQGGVSDLSFALKQSGLVASQLGLSIEDTTGTLAAFASVGLIGSDAGTSFRNMLLRLINPTNESQQLMRELGIRTRDAAGNFLGMGDLAGQLQTRLGALGDEQRDAALATIFGSDAIRAANALYESGEQGIRDWTDAVNDQGFAARVAAERMDNLTGDIEQFLGSLETAFIGVGEGADAPLRKLVQTSTDVVNAFNELPEPIQRATVLITGGGGLVLLGVAGLGKLLVAVSDVRDAMRGMNVSLASARSFLLGPWGLALAAAATSVALLGSKLVESAGDAREMEQDVRGLVTTLDEATGALTDQTRKQLIAGEAFQELITFAEALGFTVEEVTRAVFGSEDEFGRLAERIDEVQKKTGIYDEGAVDLNDRIRDQRDILAALHPEWEKQRDAQAAAGTAAEGLTDAEEDLIEVQTEAEQAADAHADALTNLDAAIKAVTDRVLGLRDANRGYEAALDAATEAAAKNGATLDTSTEKGRENEEALDAIAQAALELASEMANGGASQEEFQDHLDRSRRDIVDAAVAFGMGEEAAADFAASILDVPERAGVDFFLTGDRAVNAKLDEIRRNIQSIPGHKTVFIDIVGHGRIPEGLAHGGLVGDLPGMQKGGMITRPRVVSVLAGATEGTTP